MNQPPTTRGLATWVPTDDGPLHAILHTPPSVVRPTAVVMIGPFGLEEVVSHQARRQWAIRLAADGFSTLRVDLPGTGDSAGAPSDEGLFERWARAVNAAGEWLAQTTGAPRLAAIGVGVGGTVICAAMAHAQRFDDIVLWGVSATGTAPVRQLKAYGRMIASQHPENANGPEPANGRDIAGFLLSAETEASLEAFDLADLELRAPPGARALLLGRDVRGVEPELADALTSAGMAVTTSALGGYAELLTFPELVSARLPGETFAAVSEWLTAGATASGTDTTFTATPTTTLAAPPVAPPPAPPATARPGLGGAGQRTASAEIASHGQTIRERILELDTGMADAPPALAIVSEPVTGLRLPVTAVLLNSGNNRKIGPNRMYVDLARRWAARGIPTVRADFGGVGDAARVLDVEVETDYALHDTELHSEQMVDAANGLIEALQAQGVGTHFLLVGHCSGAYVAMHTAVRSERVVGVVSLQQYVFMWTPELFYSELLDRIRAVAGGGLIRRLREEGLKAREFKQVLAAVRHGYRGGEAAQELSVDVGGKMLDRLEARSVPTTLVLAEEGHVHEYVESLDAAEMTSRWPRLRVDRIPTRDHLARASWLQTMVHEHLDEALAQTLSAFSAG